MLDPVALESLRQLDPGGAAGVGERMAIRHTRAMVRAALDGDRFLGMVLLKPSPAPSAAGPVTDADEIAAAVNPSIGVPVE